MRDIYCNRVGKNIIDSFVSELSIYQSKLLDKDKVLKQLKLVALKTHQLNEVVSSESIKKSNKL